jgi:hypothetical protein
MIGALINAGVGLFSGYQQRKAAQKNRDYQEEQNRLAYERSLPFDSESAYGSVDFDPETRKMVQTLSPEYQKLMGDWLGISGTASSALQNMMSDPYKMEQEQFKRFEALNADAYNQSRLQGQEAAIAQGRTGTQGYYDQLAVEDAISKDRLQGQLASMQTGMDYRNMLSQESLGFGQGAIGVGGLLSGQADLGSMIGARLKPGMNMEGIMTAGNNLADTTSSYFSGLADQASQYDFDSLLSGSSTVPTKSSPNYSVRSDYGFGGNNTRNMTSSIFSSRPSGLLR